MLMNSKSIMATSTVADDRQLESTQGKNGIHGVPSGVPSRVPSMNLESEESHNFDEFENVNENTDTSSFLPVSEVKKRLWDEGEKLKWQKDENYHSTQKNLFQNDKEASLFKSRYYHAAEIAQKHCMENKNYIPVPSNYQASIRHSASSQENVKRSNDVQVEKLLAKLSSIKRDDPKSAFQVIESILENHGEDGKLKENKQDCERANESAESPILPPEYYEESTLQVEDDTSSIYSDSDDSTVSSITNPTYMSGFGEYLQRQIGKQQSEKPIQSERSTANLMKDHPYYQRRSSELPPLKPQHFQTLSRKLKPLTDSNMATKSRIRRKSNKPRTSENVQKDNNPHADLARDDACTTNNLRSSASDIPQNNTNYKPNSLSGGGSSLSNQGLLSKLKSMGSDSDDKEDDAVIIPQPKSPKSPRSPGERLKRLADAANKVQTSDEIQNRLLDRKRRFLYPKRGSSPVVDRHKNTIAGTIDQTKSGDPAWHSTEQKHQLNENFFRVKQSNVESVNGTYYHNECIPFDPFEGGIINDSFANELLAEKFSRMEKAYQNL
jgi:hypothetical protein